MAEVTAFFEVGLGIKKKRKSRRRLKSNQLDWHGKKNAQARNRTGGPTMATLDFTTKPLALGILPPARIELATFALQVQRSTTKLRRRIYDFVRIRYLRGKLYSNFFNL